MFRVKGVTVRGVVDGGRIIFLTKRRRCSGGRPGGGRNMRGGKKILMGIYRAN